MKFLSKIFLTQHRRSHFTYRQPWFIIGLLAIVLVSCDRSPKIVTVTTPMPTNTPTQVAINSDVATAIAASIPTPESDDLQSPTATPSLTATSATCDLPEGWVVYTVQPFDTLFSLAAQTDITVAEIKDANCILDDLIIVGDPLFLPSLPPAPVIVSGGGDGSGIPEGPEEPDCSLFACPDGSLADRTWPLGGPNYEYEPCAVDEPRTKPWVSFETENDTILVDGESVPDPMRFDRELGQRSYYFLCYPEDFLEDNTIDIENIEAKLFWQGQELELDVASSPASPLRKMGNAQAVALWNAICDNQQTFPVGQIYTIKFFDNLGNEPELSFKLNNPTRQRILTVPPASPTTSDTNFEIYLCGYKDEEMVQVDFYYEKSFETDGQFYNLGHSQSVSVIIDANGWGKETLTSLANDPPRSYFLIDNELRLNGSDQFWLIP